MESFVERWFHEAGGPALDVWFVEALAVFEVREGTVVVFRSERMADVLRFCLRDEVPEVTLADSVGDPPQAGPAIAIELSPWEPES